MEASSSNSPPNSASDSSKLYVGRIKYLELEVLRDYFGKFGEVKEVVTVKDKATGAVRGFGFVEFSDPNSALSALGEKEHVIGERKIDVKRARPRAQLYLNCCDNRNPARLKKIFVGGLPSSITEEEFRSYFEQFGRVTDVVIMLDKETRHPRGFGFITFEKVEAVDKVVLEKYHKLHGKRAEVKIATPKDCRNSQYNFSYSNNCSIGVQKGLATVNHPAWFYPPCSSSAPPSPNFYSESVGYGGGYSYGGGYTYGGLSYGPPYPSARIPWSPAGMVPVRSPFPYGDAYGYGYASYMGMHAGGEYPGNYVWPCDDKSNQNDADFLIMEAGARIEGVGREKLEVLQEF